MGSGSEVDIEFLADVIASSAYIAFRNALNSMGVPSHVKYYDRITNPEIGDLILEKTTMRSHRSIDRIGRLKNIYYNVKLDVNVFVIETIDGREFEWENADFIAIPEEIF